MEAFIFTQTLSEISRKLNIEGTQILSTCELCNTYSDTPLLQGIKSS